MNLAHEIIEYLNQEKEINKTINKLQIATSLAFDIETIESKLEAELLDTRYELLESKIKSFLNFVCKAFKITPDYFIHCINQYSEVSNG